MSVYRIKQFIWFIFSKVKEEDIEFIQKYLNREQLSLFQRLSKAEQKHSIRVARRMKLECENYEKKGWLDNDKINENRLISVALMHDIGKVHKTLNVIDKSLMVIFDKLTKGGVRKLKRIKKIDVYYNHAEKGAAMLMEYNFDKRALFLVKNHHNSDIIGDRELDILKYCDSIN
jgi:putative nucleotidyltransferase with HDIG domain